jgi:ribosomal protein L12E/L44/L45/RPP1/RPP2
MTYEDLKAAELRALCEQRGIKPSRAKADMIADLKAKDAADALIKHDEDAGLYAHETASEEAQAPEVPAEPEKPAESRPAILTGVVWEEGGTFYKRVPRRGSVLGDDEHEENLRDVADEARSRGREVYGPAFRDRDPDTATWVYAINVR